MTTRSIQTMLWKPQTNDQNSPSTQGSTAIISSNSPYPSPQWHLSQTYRHNNLWYCDWENSSLAIPILAGLIQMSLLQSQTSTNFLRISYYLDNNKIKAQGQSDLELMQMIEYEVTTGYGKRFISKMSECDEAGCYQKSSNTLVNLFLSGIYFSYPHAIFTSEYPSHTSRTWTRPWCSHSLQKIQRNWWHLWTPKLHESSPKRKIRQKIQSKWICICYLNHSRRQQKNQKYPND